ncbi:Prokaryotic RING finger 4 [Trifolium repens]|nr:E3 Ubiquitin ligase family protein [Trifolium repens]WJX78773.1 Prokaryotic RING finger 4 [Trifolium repens]
MNVIDPWTGIGCCLSAIALYYLKITISKDADILKSVTRVKQLKELGQLLDTQNSPLLVEISGKVASDSTIICELSGLAGVIVEDTVHQHFLKYDNSSRKWIENFAVTSFMSKEVPWYLEDATGCVDVVGAQAATDFMLPFQKEVFKQSKPWIIHRILHYFRGLKELGFKRIERTLPINTSLTVIGEVSKDDAGTIRIQQPESGPFYVSRNTIDDLIIANHGDLARLCKHASIGLSIFGSCIIAYHTIQYILAWRQQCEMHKRVLEAAAKEAIAAKQYIEGKMDDDFSDLCVICIDQKSTVAFVPCGHMCCCKTCSRPLKICPLCRGRIKQVLQIFRP